MALSFCVVGSAASNRRARGVTGIERIDERQHIADRAPAFGRSAPRLLLVPALCALSGRFLLLRRLFRKGSAGCSRVMHPVCIVTRYVGEILQQAIETDVLVVIAANCGRCVRSTKFCVFVVQHGRPARADGHAPLTDRADDRKIPVIQMKGHTVFPAIVEDTAREIEGKLLNMHNDIPNAYVYNPITEIPNDLVWEFLLKGDCRSPWGSDMKYLFSLYQGENLGEEKSVLGEVDREKIPVTGNSRFGCWCCTMVKEDKSLQNFINKGATELIPLREFRNELLRMRENSQYRDSKRRNGSVYKKSDGSFGMGPFTLEARCLILEKLLDLENRTGMELITEAELKAIDKMWDEEGDLTCRALVETYHKVKGKKLPWDDYKTPRFDDEAIQAIRDVADKYDIPVELITKLIVSVDTNKHITKNNKMQKAFDSIIGQGWLHYNSVEGALNHED